MKLKIAATALLFSAQLNAQVVIDDLSWVTSATASATSPDINFCSDTLISYEITTPGNQFGPSTDLTHPNGIILPANVTGSSATNIPFNINFSTEVCNLRMHVYDIDGGEENIHSITPSYSSLASEVGVFIDPGVSMDAVDATGPNATGWIQWDGPLSNLSATYYRPIPGYGLIIDSIIFECCETTPPLFCECPHFAQFNAIGSVDSEGDMTSTIQLNSMGTPVKSIFIDLPFYVSNVDDDCIKHEPNSIEQTGTIVEASAIAGVPGALYDPYNLGYSRRVYWTFSTPTAVNSSVELDLKFPGVLNLSSCDNAVSYCLDVTFVNEDCTACGDQICTSFTQDTTTLNITSLEYDQSAKETGFLLAPNPADGKVEIQIRNEALIGGEVRVITSSGDTALTLTITELKKTIDVAHLAKGTYLVSIENNGLVVSAKLIVK